MSDNTSDETTTVRLGRPIVSDAGAPIETLSLRAPTVGDDIQASVRAGTPAEHEVHLFALLAGLSYEEIKRMHLRDYGALQEAFRTAFFTSDETPAAAPPSTSAASSASPGRTS